MLVPSRVDVNEALGYLGYAGQTLDASLALRLDRARDLCEGMVPRGVARAFPVASVELGAEGGPCAVRLAGTPLVLKGASVARHLKNAVEVQLIAVTLGLESELLLRREQAISPTDALLVDACASSLVERAAEALCAQLAQQAASRGFVLGERFSPGYGDFPLSVQRAFLDASGAAKALGISVTAGDLLVPSKSITAVAGLVPLGQNAEGACVQGACAGELHAEGASPHAQGRRAEGACAGAAHVQGACVGTPDDSPARKCAACHLAASCLLRSQGRTCHGRAH